MTQTPGDPPVRVLLPRVGQVFTGHVREVGSDQWTRPTPCTEWSVRDLVNHVTSEHLWVPDLLGGRTVEEVGDAYDGDVLGADPAAAWDRAFAASRRAWAETPVDTVVHLSRGRTPATVYAEEMVLDLLVHGWDLARALGQEGRLNPAFTAHVLAYVESHEDDLTASGAFERPHDDDPSDGDQQARLLRLLGRSPTWAPPTGGHEVGPG